MQIPDVRGQQHILIVGNLRRMAASGLRQPHGSTASLIPPIPVLSLNPFPIRNWLQALQQSSSPFAVSLSDQASKARILQTSPSQGSIDKLIPGMHPSCCNGFTMSVCCYNSGVNNPGKTKSVSPFQKKIGAITHAWSGIGAKLERVAV